MPRTLVRSSRRSRSTRSKWLPEAVQEAFSTLIARIKGGLVIAASLAFAIAMLSHNIQDPSWNTGVKQGVEIHNLLGTTGSYVSDFVWQLFGGAGIIFAFVFAAWGWRISSNDPPDKLIWRIFIGFVSVMAMAITLSALFSATGSGVSGAAIMLSGGAFGKIISHQALALLPAGWGRYLLAFITFIVSAVTFYSASALTSYEWNILSRLLSAALNWVSQYIKAGWFYAWRFMRNERNDIFDEPDLLDEEDDEVVRKPPDKDEEKDDEEEEDEEPVVSKRKRKSLVQRPNNNTKQPRLALRPDHDFPMPPLELLHWPDQAKISAAEVSEEALEKNAKLLESVLADFGVNGHITKVSPGPVVTLYELEPSPGTRAARVISLADDIARNMSAASVRVAVVPGRNAIGIELPNRRREMVYLRELLSTEVYADNKGTLPLVLGKDIAGGSVIVDLARMPHLLIAGTTGSGKSVAINTMILSLIYRLPPQKCRFIMVDPKMLELSVYDGIPHLLAPVVTEPKKAIMALKWTVREMEERYRAMSKLGVRNIEGYNARLRSASKNGESLMRTVQTGFDRATGKPTYEEQPLDLTELPYIVVIVDEMADLMIVAGKEIEGAVQRLAQMARAAGIHLMMATQRPSVDVITGTIKANFPTRISFQVTSKIDSRTILGEQGAEQLLGQGDMLYMAGGGRITRVHGPFVNDGEVEAIVKFLKAQGEPEYLEEVTEDDGSGLFGDGSGSEGTGGSGSNDLYDKAVDIVLRERKASISFVQRHLQIGYNRAATLIERMEREGIISGADHVGRREIYGRKPDDYE